MSTGAGGGAAPEDAATEAVGSERPGLASADPDSADSATSTPGTADRGVEGGVEGGGEGGGGDGGDTAPADGPGAVDPPDGGAAPDAGGNAAADRDEGFASSMLRDSTVTGLPGETGAPPAEPHAPQAQQQDS